MKILITGASGFIGTRVSHYLVRNENVKVYGTYLTNEFVRVESTNHERLDVSNKQAVNSLFQRIGPNIVIHIAGTKDVAFCQRYPQRARQIHVEGTNNVTSACQELRARLIYVSSDCVFNGTKQIYFEEDIAKPFNTYGQVKFEGEKIVLSSSLSFIIIRSSILFGYHLPLQSSNTVSDTINSLANNQRIEMPTNLYNTHIYIGEGAMAISKIALSNLEGIFHLSGKDSVSRYELALATAQYFGLNENLVEPIESALGLRPKYSCLNSNKLERSLKIELSGIKEGLLKMKSDGVIPSGITLLDGYDKHIIDTKRYL